MINGTAQHYPGGGLSPRDVTAALNKVAARPEVHRSLVIVGDRLRGMTIEQLARKYQSTPQSIADVLEYIADLIDAASKGK
jgi:hypothetical protein